jgi:hypothetical protein
MFPIEGPQQLDGVTARAVSPDGLVEAVAGPFGDLRELRLDPRHQRVRDAATLAATITATVHEAAENAARSAFARVATYFPPGTRPEEADLFFGPVLREFDRAHPRGMTP